MVHNFDNTYIHQKKTKNSAIAICNGAAVVASHYVEWRQLSYGGRLLVQFVYVQWILTQLNIFFNLVADTNRPETL